MRCDNINGPGAVRAAIPALTTQAKELLHMANTDLPSIDYLRQRLRYDPESGKLYWREFKGAALRWRSRWANKEAGTTSRYGYRIVNVDNVFLRVHRVAWAIVHGAWPTKDIDHIDHDRENNRIKNLRSVDREDNCRNSSLSKRNTSGFSGVTWCKRTQKWQAQIAPNRRNIFLGRFSAKNDAIAARKAAEVKYGFHANHGVQAAQIAMKD